MKYIRTTTNNLLISFFACALYNPGLDESFTKSDGLNTSVDSVDFLASTSIGGSVFLSKRNKMSY